MGTEDRLVFVGTSDLAGILRGRSFPVSDWAKRLRRGVGWTPTNVQITCFDTISDSPFGSFGDLALIPDPETRFALQDGEDVFDFALGDIRSLEGEPWEFCTRSLARRALQDLHQVSGATPLGAFEHEFQIKEAAPRPGDGFGLKGFRDAKAWSGPFLAALAQTSCQPDTFMKEYGPSQYEVTIKPTLGIVTPDNAAILRLLAHDVIARHGAHPSFSPILDAEGVGNGVHIHFSFVDDEGTPLTYDPQAPYGMSTLTRHFIGGILHHLDQILALLAPSEISYLRLTPHRWSAAFNNLGYRDREASVRICPVSSEDEEAVARQYNFEVRAVDAAASPHLAFAALLFAGTQGVKDQIEPPAPLSEDLSLLSPAALAAKGFKRLPQSLEEALEKLGESKAVRQWFGDAFVDLYIAHKHGEIAQLAGLDQSEKCNRYKDVY
ncbi:MAG: glutamine synthetase family protein [Proteobacteria bacterium]|nr:glutamine synthetase family protein [Pseudomonadota bacterium]